MIDSAPSTANPAPAHRTWLRKVRRARRLGLRKCLLLLEATCLLGMARAIVLLIPVKRFASLLGRLHAETPAESTAREAAAAQRVGWAIRFASAYTPWESNCFAQAIAGKLMLRARRISSTLYLGVKKERGELAAHAWLRVGPRIVTGGATQPQFTAISCFGS
jgi:hypothetical protein